MELDGFEQLLDMDIEFEDYIDQTDDCDVSFNNLNNIIGHIEDIVISENFQVGIEHFTLEVFIILFLFSKTLQTDFLDKYCTLFTNEEENKIYYTDIFNEYTKVIEEFILVNLNKNIPNINMGDFLTELRYFGYVSKTD